MSKEKYINVLPKGTVVRSEDHTYTIEEVLGQGGFGITYKVIDEKSQVLALKEHFMRNKCFRKDDNVTLAFHDTAASEVKDSLKEFRREGRLLKEISDQCPNIVRVYEVFDAYNTAYYTMEYLGGGSLRDLVRKKKGPLDEKEARAIMEPIAIALTYLHSKKILHMDIKPDNIVMRVNPDDDTPTPVLIDFGVSLHFDDKDKLTTTHHIAGVTRGFSPIEQYDPVERFAPSVDIYALAATWFYLLAGHNPKAATEIKQEDILQNLPDNISDYTRHAIVEGMKFRYENRPQSVEDFIRLMDGSDTIGIFPTRPSRRKALLTRIAIAACVLAAIAAGVTWWVNNKETHMIKETEKENPNTLEQKKLLEPKTYKMLGKMSNDSTFKQSEGVGIELYINIADNDSINGIFRGKGDKKGYSVKGNLINGDNLVLKLEITDGNDHIPIAKIEGKYNKDDNSLKGKYTLYTSNLNDSSRIESQKNELFINYDDISEIASIPPIPIIDVTKPNEPQKPVADKKKDKQTDDIQKKEEQTKSNEGDTPPKTETENTTGNTPESEPTETPPPPDPFRTKVDSLLRH